MFFFINMNLLDNTSFCVFIIGIVFFYPNTYILKLSVISCGSHHVFIHIDCALKPAKNGSIQILKTSSSLPFCTNTRTHKPSHRTTCTE